MCKGINIFVHLKKSVDTFENIVMRIPLVIIVYCENIVRVYMVISCTYIKNIFLILLFCWKDLGIDRP